MIIKRISALLISIAVGMAAMIPCTYVSAEKASDENTIDYPDPSIKENLPDEKPTAAEDFYACVNYDFIKNAEFPAGYLGLESDYSAEEQINNEMEELLSGDCTGNEKQEILSTIYKEYVDTDSRNASGWDSVRPYVEKIEQAETLDDLMNVITADQISWKLYGFFTITRDIDYKDATKYVVGFHPTVLHLDDSEYTEMTDNGKSKKSADDTYFTNLLTKYGYTDEEIQTLIADQFSLEERIAAVYNAEVSDPYDLSEVYNPVTEDELIEMSGSFPMEALLKNLGISGQEKYVLADPDFFKTVGSFVTEENLPELKAYAIIHFLEFASKYSDEEAYDYYYDHYTAGYEGVSATPIELLAYATLQDILPELTGDVYAESFFDESKVDDIREIADNVGAAVRKRLESADWLSEETRQNALDKFDAITVYIGCADVDFYDYSEISPNADSDLFTNILAVEKEIYSQDLNKCGSSVNRDAWGIACAADVINGTYDSTTNSVHITAAFLTEPHYSKDYRAEQKYGSIGALIGHELTHAFDYTGSQFDKDGNMNNWWTDEDRETFTELCKEVTDRYAQYVTYSGMHVDGDLVRGESVADLGGMAAALDALEALYDGDTSQINYEDFFTQYATVFAVSYEDDGALVAVSGVHPPCCLRVNVNVAQFEQFYDTFGVKEGDAMYTAPEDRLHVW